MGEANILSEGKKLYVLIYHEFGIASFAVEHFFLGRGEGPLRKWLVRTKRGERDIGSHQLTAPEWRGLVKGRGEQCQEEKERRHDSFFGTVVNNGKGNPAIVGVSDSW